MVGGQHVKTKKISFIRTAWKHMTWSQCHSGSALRFLLSSRLLWGPDKWRIRSCKDSNVIEQKQQLKWLLFPSSFTEEMTLRWTEQRCLRRWAFCLNIATQRRQANGFSPVWTRRWVFKFQLMPNCLPQYVQRYSLALPTLLLVVQLDLLIISSFVLFVSSCSWFVWPPPGPDKLFKLPETWKRTNLFKCSFYILFLREVHFSSIHQFYFQVGSSLSLSRLIRRTNFSSRKNLNPTTYLE